MELRIEVIAAVLQPQRTGQASGTPGRYRDWSTDVWGHPFFVLDSSTASKLFKNCRIVSNADLPTRKDFLNQKHKARIPLGDPGFGTFFCQGRMAYAMYRPSRMILVSRSHEWLFVG
jgi:hypothetical protein